MTTYILAGGGDRKSPTYGEKLAAEVHQRKSGPLRILSCFFAEPREVWENKFAQRQAWFQAAFGAEAAVDLAFPATFREQIKTADVVYLHGGDDTLLGFYLNQFDDIRDMFAGKIVIGSSAGADWLSASFWACDWRETRHGSGLASLNIMVHYGSNFGTDDPRGAIDWARAEADFQVALGSEKVTRLPEGEYIISEV